MRERVKRRPCVDGRSRKARRARLIKLEEVVPRTRDYAVKRRAVRFMLGRNFSHAYIANQLGMSVPDLEAMIRDDSSRGEVRFVPAFVGEVKALTDREEAVRRAERAMTREREERDAREGRPR
jgi:hypothetical protein